MKFQLSQTLMLCLLCGCSTPAQVISTDLTRQSGVYVIGHVDSEEIRARLEDRFVADLTDRDIRALASRHDIKRIKTASPADMVRAANAHDVAAIVIINRVDKDGTGGLIKSEQAPPADRQSPADRQPPADRQSPAATNRLTPDNPDLQAYYEASRNEQDDYEAGEPVFAEVNAFLVDGNKTRRFWTGTSWAFQGASSAGNQIASGYEGAAAGYNGAAGGYNGAASGYNIDTVISSISETIATELARVSREMRDYSRPIQ